MKVDILCIGTPNVIGDSLGPLVGTMLSVQDLPKDIKVIGTLRRPVTFDNYEVRLKELRPDAKVIAVDAAIGDKVGEWEISTGPLIPGLGVAANLQPIGDMSVKCYTGKDIVDMFYCKSDFVYLLADAIATELMVRLLIEKRVYI